MSHRDKVAYMLLVVTALLLAACGRPSYSREDHIYGDGGFPSTHTVWRNEDTGQIEGECRSVGTPGKYDLTLIPCLSDDGLREPIWTDSKATVYPYPVEVDYETGRVCRRDSP